MPLFLRVVFAEAPAGLASRERCCELGCGVGMWGLAPGLENRLPRWVWRGCASSETVHAGGGSLVGLKPVCRDRDRVLWLCCWFALSRKLSRS